MDTVFFESKCACWRRKVPMYGTADETLVVLLVRVCC